MRPILKLFNKKFFALLLLGLILSVYSYDAYGMGRHRKPGGCSRGDGTVGAPLDGGLLAIILGSAGVAYFAAKRKKKQD